MPIELITKKNNIELVVPSGKGVAEAYEQGYNKGYGIGHSEGFEEGKNSVVSYTQYAKAIRFNNLNDFKTNDLTIKLENAVDLSKFLYIENEEDINNTVEYLTINCDKPIINMNNFYNHKNTKHKDNTLKGLTFNFDISQCVDITNMLGNLSALEVINGEPLNFTSVSSGVYPLLNLTALREVRFVANSIYKNFFIHQSSNLSDDTIASLIEGLANLNGEPKFYEVGNQISPSDFEYPAVEKELKDVISYEDAYMFMTDGAPVYSVTYGDSWINTYAYAKGGIAQTLWLHADVKAKLTDEQKATIAAKNWILS